MNTKKNTSIIENDEIDLTRLFSVIARRWSIIVVSVLLGLAMSYGYIISAKTIYTGDVMVEIGEVINNNNNVVQPIYNANDLSIVIEKTMAVRTSIPTGARNIIQVSCEGSTKDQIKQRLAKAVEFILLKSKEKAVLYDMNNSKIQQTVVIGNIQVGEEPKGPKKIVIFIVGIILSLICALFLILALDFFERNNNTKESLS